MTNNAKVKERIIMTYQNKFRKLCLTKLCLAMLILPGLLATAPSALAQGREAIAHGRTFNHSLGSAPGTWRIELRDLEHFLAMSSGDSDGVSELQRLSIKLSGDGNQYDAVTETNPFFRVSGGPRTTNNVIDVQTGARLKLDRLDDNIRDNYNLWIHVKERPGGEFPATVNFQIEVKARELDCIRDRACRRNDTGIVTYHVNLDIPSTKSLSCIPANSYRIRAVNGATMTLRPKETRSGRNVRQVRHVNSGTSNGAGSARGAVRGPHMAMQSGDICIASTSRPATYIKNTSAQTCITLPAGNVPRVASLRAPACRYNRNRPEDKKAQWRIKRKGTDYWSIKNTVSNHCFNAKGSEATSNGGPVKAVGCSAHNDQSWRKIGRGSHGHYILRNVSSNKCLTTENGLIKHRRCSGQATQLWYSIPEYR